MTNLLFYLTFSLTTNWTILETNGPSVDFAEVRSNTVATCVYQGKTNTYIHDSKLIATIRRHWRVETTRIASTTYMPETERPWLLPTNGMMIGTNNPTPSTNWLGYVLTTNNFKLKRDH